MREDGGGESIFWMIEPRFPKPSSNNTFFYKIICLFILVLLGLCCCVQGFRWRRKWQPTPVFLPGESQGRGSLVGGHLWGRTEPDTTEVT